MDNKAAWITEAKANPLTVDAGPKPSPGADEVVVKVYYAAVNPVDWKIQDYGIFIQKYPNILGTDVAGEIVQVGSGVERLKVGQRVLAHAIGLGTGKPEDGAYQHYATVPEILTAPIPDSLPYANASVLPLAISTASAALFQKSHLGLDAPTMSHKSTGKTILVWGGSSSVGSTAIQLASAAGVTVATTASSHNHDYVKSMGAMHVFDHTKSSVVDDIVSALKGSTFAGAFDAISEEKTIKSSAEVASQLGGGVVATTLPPPETGLPENVEAKGVFAITIGTQQKEVGDAIWRKFVPEALAQGKLQAKPDPMVIKGGLSAVQEGLDKQKAGVSAKKVVVEIQEVGS